MAEAISCAMVIAASTFAINWVYWMQYESTMSTRRAMLVALHFTAVCAIVVSYFAVFTRTFQFEREGLLVKALGGLSFAAGAYLFVWSSLVHKTSLIPRDDADLTHVGPYRLVRHPIYSSGIFAALGLLLAAPSLGLALDWLVLVVCMMLLIRSEERELVQRMPGYAEYAKHTAALIPSFRVRGSVKAP